MFFFLVLYLFEIRMQLPFGLLSQINCPFQQAFHVAMVRKHLPLHWLGQLPFGATSPQIACLNYMPNRLQRGGEAEEPPPSAWQQLTATWLLSFQNSFSLNGHSAALFQRSRPNSPAQWPVRDPVLLGFSLRQREVTGQSQSFMAEWRFELRSPMHSNHYTTLLSFPP